MTLGSDYAAGVNIGMRERSMNDSKTLRALSNISSSRRGTMGGMNRPGSNLKTAKEIRDEAIEEALNRKAKELEIQAAEQAMVQKDIMNKKAIEEADQRIQAGEDERYGRASDRRRTGIKTSLDEAEYWRGRGKERTAERKESALENAIKGFYANQPEAVKAYFDKFGGDGISIEGFQTGPEGEVIVDFGGGNTEAFPNVQTAINRLLISAEAIRKSQEKEKADIEEAKEQKKHERAIEMIEKEHELSKGMSRDKEAEYRNKAIKAWEDRFVNPDTGKVREDAIPQAEYIQAYMDIIGGKKTTSKGKDTPGKGITVKKKIDTSKQEIKRERNKRTGKIRITYKDGTQVIVDGENSKKASNY